MAADDVGVLGLRERKKLKTRLAIQNQALRLFRDKGYEATTVAEIAEAADVSESTFFRYFPGKADVVLWDEFDPQIAEAFRHQPADLTSLQALRAAFSSVFTTLSPQRTAEQRERLTLALSVPEVRASALDQLASTIGLLASLVAERASVQPDDMGARALAGAVIGAAVAVMLTFPEDPNRDLAEAVDNALSHLEHLGDLPFRDAPPPRRTRAANPR